MAFTELDVSVTLPPAQKVVGLPDIVGVAGTALIVTDVVVEYAVQPPVAGIE